MYRKSVRIGRSVAVQRFPASFRPLSRLIPPRWISGRQHHPNERDAGRSTSPGRSLERAASYAHHLGGQYEGLRDIRPGFPQSELARLVHPSDTIRSALPSQSLAAGYICIGARRFPRNAELMSRITPTDPSSYTPSPLPLPSPNPLNHHQRKPHHQTPAGLSAHAPLSPRDSSRSPRSSSAS